MLEVTGRSPEIDFNKIRGKEINLKTDKDYLDKNFINHESRKGDDRREVGLQRVIDLPRAPSILDELIVSRENVEALIVRIEKFELNCAAAFRIDDNFSIHDSV